MLDLDRHPIAATLGAAAVLGALMALLVVL